MGPKTQRYLRRASEVLSEFNWFDRRNKRRRQFMSDRYGADKATYGEEDSIRVLYYQQCGQRKLEKFIVKWGTN